MKRNDLFIAVLLCTVGIAVFFLSSTIPTMLLVERSSIINSQFYPKLLSLLLFVCGILLGLQAVTQREGPYEDTDSAAAESAGGTKGVARMLVTGVVCVLYLLLFLPLGFLLSTMLLMVALLVLLGSRTWYGIVFPAVIVPAGVYILFRILLGVPLPRGVLGFF